MNTSAKVTIVFGAIIIIACVVMCFIGNGDVENGTWTPYESLDAQLEIVDRSYDKWFKERMDVMSTAGGKNVVCDWLMYKSYTASNSDKHEEALETFNADSMEFVVSHTIRADYWSSIVAWEEFVKAYESEAAKDELIEKCKDVAPELGKYFDNEIAAFKQLATVENFVDEAGKLRPEKQKRAQLLHRYVWIQASQLQFPPNVIQTPEEKMGVFRWQIEESHMLADAKLKKLQETQQIYPKAYDYNYAAAVVEIEAQRYEEACDRLRPILESTTDQYIKEQYSRAIKHIRSLSPSTCAK